MSKLRRYLQTFERGGSQSSYTPPMMLVKSWFQHVRLVSIVVALSLSAFIAGCNANNADVCAPSVYFNPDVTTGGFLGYVWNGTACVSQAGSLCEGSCTGLYYNIDECVAAHRQCIDAH